ncbi:hypothetical protein [Pendulispora albinea]|uniref:Uncharacterized protein n=1 Tax=Pendulispora albinea TaxID=2741071 RepID=A0ABZ2M3Q1_9BACT
MAMKAFSEPEGAAAGAYHTVRPEVQAFEKRLDAITRRLVETAELDKDAGRPRRAPFVDEEVK